MNECISESINNFGYTSLAHPSRDLQEAIDSLLMRIDLLEEENLALKSRLELLEKDQAFQEEERATMARKIKKLEIQEDTAPGLTDLDRIEKLKFYLQTKKDMGQKPEISFLEARAYLDIKRSLFSQLIKKLDTRDFVITRNPLNYKIKMIGLARKM